MENMELEDAINSLKTLVTKANIENTDMNDILQTKELEAISTVLQALEKYKRLAEANLNDSEEFQNNMCEYRCLLKSELENSIPKEVIEKVFETKIYNEKYLAYTDWSEHQKEIDIQVANILEIIKQELLEEE